MFGGSACGVCCVDVHVWFGCSVWQGEACSVRVIIFTSIVEVFFMFPCVFELGPPCQWRRYMCLHLVTPIMWRH